MTTGCLSFHDTSNCFDGMHLFALGTLLFAHTALNPHEVSHHPLPVLALPLHGVGLGPVGEATAAALARGAVLRPVLLHARAPVELEADGLHLTPRVLAARSSLQTRRWNMSKMGKQIADA
jgi:hypothetical protein